MATGGTTSLALDCVYPRQGHYDAASASFLLDALGGNRWPKVCRVVGDLGNIIE